VAEVGCPRPGAAPADVTLRIACGSCCEASRRDWIPSPSQGKVSTGSKTYAKRKSTSPSLLDIPAFDRILGSLTDT